MAACVCDSHTHIHIHKTGSICKRVHGSYLTSLLLAATERRDAIVLLVNEGGLRNLMALLGSTRTVVFVHLITLAVRVRVHVRVHVRVCVCTCVCACAFACACMRVRVLVCVLLCASALFVTFL